MKPSLALYTFVCTATVGCAVRTWQIDSRPVPRVIEKVIAEDVPRTVRLTLRDGALLTLSWPYIYGDTVSGVLSGGDGARLRVPLADVRSVARRRVNWPLSVVATTAAGAGVAFGVALVVCATGGCFNFHHMLDGLVSRRSSP